MTFYAITTIEFDAGHRVPDHLSKCKNPHGHRYKVEASVGSRNLHDGGPETGMVTDFSNTKRVLMEKVHDVLDHGFIVWGDDTEVLERLTHIPQGAQEAPQWKVIRFPYTPTAENIAQWIFEEIEDDVKGLSSEDHDVWLDAIIVWETPNNKTIYHGPYSS